MVVRAVTTRGRQYALFGAVLVGIYTLLAWGQFPRDPVLLKLFCVPHIAVYIHFFMLAAPRDRGVFYRIAISLPAATMVAAMMLGMPWAISRAIGHQLPGEFLPYLIATCGFLASLSPRREVVVIPVLRENKGPAVARVNVPRKRVSSLASASSTATDDALRIVQLTDTHLGPFMSVDALAAIATRAVDSNPDLVFLTGDFLTMESHSDHTMLRRALAPLAALKGRVFACYGNHDYEAPAHVNAALASIGAKLLRDEEVITDTRLGAVSILGFEFRYRKRAEMMRAVCTQYPKDPSMLRLVLLHDPNAIVDLPPGEGDLVFSGHMHGGQIGFWFLGLNWTIPSALRSLDHGLWSRGTDRVYAHRGTGHYGFPLRLGVPAEESLLLIRADGLLRANAPVA